MIRTLTDANHTCFRLTSQCIFIYFSATRYDRRYYVIILLNVTLNTISIGKTVQRKPRCSCSARTICCTRRNPFNRTNGKFPSVYALSIIPVCLGCFTHQQQCNMIIKHVIIIATICNLTTIPSCIKKNYY